MKKKIAHTFLFHIMVIVLVFWSSIMRKSEKQSAIQKYSLFPMENFAGGKLTLHAETRPKYLPYGTGKILFSQN